MLLSSTYSGRGAIVDLGTNCSGFLCEADSTGFGAKNDSEADGPSFSLPFNLFPRPGGEDGEESWTEGAGVDEGEEGEVTDVGCSWRG